MSCGLRTSSVSTTRRSPGFCRSASPAFVLCSRGRGRSLPIFCGVVALANRMKGETSMSYCPWESRIAIAVAADSLPEDLVLHLVGCPGCREAHMIAGKMRRIANGLAEEPGPSAASMWWRLNLRLRRERAREAEIPLVWMRRIFYVVIAL